jgi:predicted DNA-binding transcriptional regulator AlpA
MRPKDQGHMTEPGELLHERDVAGLLGISRGTVKHWRARPDRYGPRPPYIKIGKIIRYPRSLLMKFLAEAEVRACRHKRS